MSEILPKQPDELRALVRRQDREIAALRAQLVVRDTVIAVRTADRDACVLGLKAGQEMLIEQTTALRAQLAAKTEECERLRAEITCPECAHWDHAVKMQEQRDAAEKRVAALEKIIEDAPCSCPRHLIPHGGNCFKAKAAASAGKGEKT